MLHSEEILYVRVIVYEGSTQLFMPRDDAEGIQMETYC